MFAPEADLRPAGERSTPRLYCLLLCDLADSTLLIERLGDARAADLIRQHDRVARDTLQRHHGREIDKTDGFLILFERPIEAVAFALDYRQELARIGEANGFRLEARVGIHVGEVLSWRNAEADIAGGAKPIEIEGLAKAIAARLMALADPGQILLSESAYSLALRARSELPGDRPVRWKEHGRYRLQGVAAPVQVFEVGAIDSPMQPPRDKIKARRMQPWYRWKPLYALLLLAAVVAPLWQALKPAPAIAFTERDWIVVADLRNLTGDPQFDMAVDRAIRLGLEQSRFVNVLSLLRQRQVLQQMGRESDSPLDRSLGSEVAQRVGARAVMLATLSQNSGRLRLTTELVDPRSEATVYTESSEIDSMEAVLPAVDNVLRSMRAGLGESLARIDETTPPLANIVTPSLDALRAYSVGVSRESDERHEEARQAFELALSLDPGFAAADAGLARYWYVRGDTDKALAGWERALARPDRLTERQRLTFEAMVATLRGDTGYIERWKAILAIYPDQHIAAHNLAQFLWDENQFAESQRYAALANTPQSPTAVASGFVGAMATLGLGDVARARSLYAASRLAGGELPARICAALAAAEGDQRAAMDCFDKLADEASPGQRADALWFRAVLARDAGDIATATHQLELLEALLPQLDGVKGRALRAAVVMMRWRLAAGTADAAESFAALAAPLVPSADALAIAERRAAEIAAAAIGQLALREGDRELFDRFAPLRADRRAASPYARALWAAVDAFRLHREGDTEGAIAMLRAARGPEAPLLVDLLLAQVYEETGDVDGAASARRLLRQRRPVAFAEYGESYLLLDEYLAAMRRQ